MPEPWSDCSAGARFRPTVINRFELLLGAANPKQRARVSGLLEAVPALMLDDRAADAAGEIGRVLARSGRPIGMADSLIAGIVVSSGGTLLTRNCHPFER